MSRSLSVASVIEKNRLASDSPYLLFVDVDVVNPATKAVVEVLSLVLNNEDISYQGKTYVATAFDIELKEEANSQPQVNISFADMTRALQARMQQYGGGVGFGVTLTVQAANNLTQEPEIVERFQVIGATAKDYSVVFQIGAENTLTKAFPRRRQARDFCQWRYKSAECGYTGGLPTCDFTLGGANGCKAHNNTIRFGAFPGLNNDGRRLG